MYNEKASVLYKPRLAKCEPLFAPRVARGCSTRGSAKTKKAPMGFFVLVDPRGVEPLSENLLIQPSPSAVRYLEFPLQAVNGQTSRLGSHFLRGRFNGERSAHVHRCHDAQSEVAILLGGTGGVMPRHCP